MIRIQRFTFASVVSLGLSLGIAPDSLADMFDGLDMSVGSGAVFGNVSESRPDGTTRKYTVGGIPFVAMLNRDVAEHWSGNLQVQILLDFDNEQVLRQGFAGTLCYHLLGGSRRLSVPGDLMTTVSMSRYNLSVAMRGGVFNYAASDRKNPSNNVSGGIWEMASGLEYRRAVSERSALGASVMHTLISLPTSVDRLSARSTELLGFWRVYL